MGREDACTLSLVAFESSDNASHQTSLIAETFESPNTAPGRDSLKLCEDSLAQGRGADISAAEDDSHPLAVKSCSMVEHCR